MYYLKKLLTIIIAGIMLLGLMGCNGKQVYGNETNKKGSTNVQSNVNNLQGNTNVNEDVEGLKLKISLLEQALNKFGAKTPEEAANIWAEGVKTRNGALQYAVLSNDMKQKFKEQADKNLILWRTGSSSPEIDKYDITQKKIDNSTYEISVKFQGHTSEKTISDSDMLNKLTVIKEGDFWCIKDVQ